MYTQIATYTWMIKLIMLSYTTPPNNRPTPSKNLLQWFSRNPQSLNAYQRSERRLQEVYKVFYKHYLSQQYNKQKLSNIICAQNSAGFNHTHTPYKRDSKRSFIVKLTHSVTCLTLPSSV